MDVSYDPGALTFTFDLEYAEKLDYVDNDEAEQISPVSKDLGASVNTQGDIGPPIEETHNAPSPVHIPQFLSGKLDAKRTETMPAVGEHPTTETKPGTYVHMIGNPDAVHLIRGYEQAQSGMDRKVLSWNAIISSSDGRNRVIPLQDLIIVRSQS